MDSKTIEVYNLRKEDFYRRHQAATPTRLYALAQDFFKMGASTLDLGSGIGRDAAWLNQNGYPTIGLEPAEKLLEIAQTHYPRVNFKKAHLPHLEEYVGQFDNLLCCAVIMHVPKDSLISSLKSMLNVLRPQGRAIISWRDGQGEDDGRLFETYPLHEIAKNFVSLRARVIFQEEENIWHNLVIERD